MKELNFEQMENVQGGINCANILSGPTQTVLYIFGVASLFGGALVFGPTAVLLGAASLYCSWS